MTSDPRRPVLVGTAAVVQHEDDPTRAVEAIELMRRAVQTAAGVGGAGARLLRRVGLVAVPRGQWSYQDPGRRLAIAMGSPLATTVVSEVGILQQTLIADACRRIADGELEAAVVVGAEARHRHRRGRIVGVATPETPADGEPDEVLRPSGTLVSETELRGGLGAMPVGYYAVIESAWRARCGIDVDEHRDRLAHLYAGFSRIAVDNPHAWRRREVTAAEIREPSDANPMLAFPYTRLHNSSWNVDQAAALILCSTATALELGIPRSRWVLPLASTESNHVTCVSERPDLARSPGARIAGRRALDAAGVDATALDLVELYSCFPSAVQIHAHELGLDDAAAPRVPWTVTGAMPFAGGPFNSFVLQSTCRMADLLRDRPGSVGLVSSVSGLLTKHGFGVWSTRTRDDGFTFADVTDEVAAIEPPATVLAGHVGDGTIAGCTVIHDGDATRAVAVIDLAGGARTVCSSDDVAVARAIETQECCGRQVSVSVDRFHLA